ncbi:MAG: hypothetical protein LBD30_00170, partial [Verrucomicrobiales bacterium]|nr:hypothetical protein [Verrucomicrobiales bacterium]
MNKPTWKCGPRLARLVEYCREAWKGNRRDLARTLILALPVLYGFFVVARFGVNVPAGDEANSMWFVDLFMRDGACARTFGELWEPHNEHRMLLPKLVFLGLAWLAHYDIKAAMFLSMTAAAGVYFVCLRHLWKATAPEPGRMLLGVAVGFCVFNVVQVENMLWGFQVAWFMLLFFAVAAFHWFAKWAEGGRRRDMMLCLLCGLASGLSSFHGLLVLPTILGAMVLRGRQGGRIPWKPMLATAGVLACFSAVYLQGWRKAAQHPDLFGNTPENIVTFFLCLFGAPFQIMFPFQYARIFIYQQIVSGSQGIVMCIGALVFLGSLAATA